MKTYTANSAAEQQLAKQVLEQFSKQPQNIPAPKNNIPYTPTTIDHLSEIFWTGFVPGIIITGILILLGFKS